MIIINNAYISVLQISPRGFRRAQSNNDSIESIQLTSQTPNHVEITKILSTNQRESRIIDC